MLLELMELMEINTYVHIYSHEGQAEPAQQHDSPFSMWCSLQLVQCIV
jgi:hypothetical protein